MRRRVVERDSIPVTPDRLERFRVADWEDPDDPVRVFCDGAWMRAFARYREARRAWRTTHGEGAIGPRRA